MFHADIEKTMQFGSGERETLFCRLERIHIDIVQTTWGLVGYSVSEVARTGCMLRHLGYKPGRGVAYKGHLRSGGYDEG